MKSVLPPRRLILLIVIDLLSILVVTLIGFRAHDRSLTDGRWWSTFLPVAAAWGLSAPWFGLYSQGVAERPGQVWRVGWAAVLAGPMAGLLRSLWLQTLIVPVFVAVLIGVIALGMSLTRLVWSFCITRRK